MHVSFVGYGAECSSTTKGTKQSNADTLEIKHTSPALLAYIAVIVRHSYFYESNRHYTLTEQVFYALTNATSWSPSPIGMPISAFYYEVIERLKDPRIIHEPSQLHLDSL
jgi:hypothetical protein